ncbi:SRPBCC family protein [Thiohalorhabdus sp. Cl-TMA]|uniref:SRPBCC family protein n=1 Tax=Thiohalorhabdus methylotrophus TaxID=3242694 RepID=A0ABV4TTT6_9GAMM
MQVTLEKNIPLDGPPAATWAVLQDIEEVTECLPGAEITERVDDSHYKGQVKVKVGPASSTFKGEVEVLGLDAGQHELHLHGKGQDTKGTSSATMDLKATVRDTGDGKSEVAGVSEVSVTGKMASFGGRMMEQVADQIMQQFARNLNDRVAARGEGAEAEAAAERVASQPRELNALQLAWSMVVSFFRRLFGHKGSHHGEHQA